MAGSFLREHQATLREPFGVLHGGLLGVVGLILAFGLSLAVGRYENRRDASVTEANAIGTAYLRRSTASRPGSPRSTTRPGGGARARAVRGCSGTRPAGAAHLGSRPRARSLAGATILVTLPLLVTFDLDRPTRGLVKVPDAPLAAVRASMALPPAASAPPASPSG